MTSDLGPQLLAGSSGEQRENLGVTTPEYYFYLNQSGSYTVEDVNDKKEFSDTMVTIPAPPGAPCWLPAELHANANEASQQILVNLSSY